MNVVDHLFAHARERPAHPAVEDGDRIVTYAVLAALVVDPVEELRAREIKSGDIVVVSLPDTAAHLVVLFALAKLGAVSLSVDGKSPDAEKSRAVEGLVVKAAIVANSDTRLLSLNSIPIDTVVKQVADVLADARGPAVDPLFDADHPLMVIQSSGTTGEPKRLLLTHRQLAERNRPMIAMLKLNSSDRYLQVPYLRFFWGREGAFLTMMVGGTIVLNLGSTWEDFSRYFSDHRITCVFFTPFHLRSLLSGRKNDAPLWPKLKILLSSAPLSAEERFQVRRRLTPHLFETYGTNEVGDLALAAPDDQDRYPDSSGRMIPGIEAEVVDESDSPLPLGETGEIRFRCAHFPREYLGNPKATARHFKAGWFYPGDLEALNDEGYVFLKGRTDDVINNAGAKYFPAEVEAVLLSHPAVLDAAVIGGPHPQVGEVSVAYVVQSLAISPKDLYRYCEGKIAMYKAPSWVFFLDEIPRVATGKPDKKALKETFRRYLETQAR